MGETVPLGIDGIQTGVGQHICGFYQGRHEMESLMVPYVTGGVLNGDKTLCMVDSQTPAQVLELLRRGIDVDAAVSRHQLDVKHSSDTYLVGGGFRVHEFVSGLKQLSADAVEREGFPRLRAVGEMCWAQRMFPGSEDLFTYEAEINRFIGDYNVVYFCLYDVDTISGSMVMDAIKTHPLVLIGGSLFENPYYMAPESFLARNGSDHLA